MTATEVLEQLQQLGNEQTRKTLKKHGAPEQILGVKIGDMKPIVKKIKKNHELSQELYDSGIGDAMYLAGLIADETKITKKQLHNWAEKANWQMVSEYTVPWVAAESPYGWELAQEWIDSNKENIASTGWATLGSLVSIKKDEDLDIKALKVLLKRVEKNIHTTPNRVRYTMNGFVIAVGSYVAELTSVALNTAENIGLVKIDAGGTACKVPAAKDYINKVKDKGYIGKKRKEARC